MKRNLRSTLAALVPAAAVLPNGETQQFWNAHKGALNARGICEHSADNWSFCAEFHDGLLLVQDTVSHTEDYATWDNCKEGRPVKMGRPAHQSPRGFPRGFSSILPRAAAAAHTPGCPGKRQIPHRVRGCSGFCCGAAG